MIRNPALLVVGIVVLCVTLGLLAWRAEFYLTSSVTEGVVGEITATNDRCGSKRSKHSCTRFRAYLDYDVHGTEHRTYTSAGNVRGHGQPVSRATKHVGQSIDVRYRTRNPDTAYADTLFDVWGAPIMGMCASFMMLFGSLFEGKGSRSLF